MIRSYKRPTEIVIITLAITINLLVLVNNILHDPGIGYDAQAHLDYIYVLPYRLPTNADTSEFFSAPLPYIIPSVTNFVGQKFLGITDTEFINGKTGQFVNFLLSIGITILLLKICELIASGNDYYKITSLALFGILPVYYKTFVQVRGEPYVAFFTFLLIHQIVSRLKHPPFKFWRDGIYLGLTLGLLALSRQWGFLLFPAVIAFVIPLYIQNKSIGRQYIKLLSLSLIVSFLVAGWFYIYLWVNYGKVNTFNRDEQKFSFANQPLSFYRNIGLRNFLLFKAPTRPVFDNQLFPTFYSEIWGDYWGFFVYIKEKVPSYGVYTNQNQINPYLGRVNLVSIFPTLLYIAGLWVGIKYTVSYLRQKDENIRSITVIFMTLIILASAIGYFWFLIKYPEIPRGTTIKATYMIHALTLLPFLVAEFLEKIRIAKPSWYFIVLALCGLVFVHNLPAMITRYWWFLK